MQSFVAVVESGGFSAAGRRLGLSKARVSKYVAHLEDRVGARLLHRSTRRVEPSTTGRAYYERAAPLLSELLALEASIRDSQARLSGSIRIAAPVSFAETHLVPALVGFGENHPELSLDLLLNDRRVDLVAEGVDLAVRVGRLDDSALVARRIGEVRLVLCAAPDYLAGAAPLTGPEDLAGHACVIDTNASDSDLWQFAGSETPIRVRGRFRVNSARAVRDLLVAGLGVGLCPSFMVERDLAGGRLSALLVEQEAPPIGLYVVYPHRRHLSLKVRALIEYLRQYFAPGMTTGGRSRA